MLCAWPGYKQENLIPALLSLGQPLEKFLPDLQDVSSQTNTTMSRYEKIFADAPTKLLMPPEFLLRP